MVSNETLIKDLQEFADELGRTPTAPEMSSSGPWAVSTYQDHFGSWNGALEEAELQRNKYAPTSTENLIQDLQEFADELGRTPTRREMMSSGPWAVSTYQKHFGSWNAALREAGIEVNELSPTNLSTEQLIEDLQEFADELERTPTMEELNTSGPWTASTYQNHFGSWNNALREAGIEVVHMGPSERAGTGKYAYGEGYSDVRRKCFNRDNYNCRACGERSELHCHHIMPRSEFDSVAESNTLNNVITLCRSCHTKFEGLWTEADPDTFAANAQSYFDS